MKTKNLLPFHLAIPVNDLEKSRNFYKNILGCEEGRSSNHWVCLLYTSPSPRD